MADVRIVELLINVKMVTSLMKQSRCLTKEMGFNGLKFNLCVYK